MRKVSTNVYVETGFRGCNVGFVVTSEGVVVIDTPQMPVDAVKWRDEMEQYGPVRYVINTEPHGDHFTGNHFFAGTIIAQEGVREAIKAASLAQIKERIKQRSPESLPFLKDFDLHPPDITFSERFTLYLGKHTFRMTHMPGHTPYQAAVYIPEERVIFTSDNVFCRVQAWLQQAVPYEWLETLKQLEKVDADTLIPGHGELCDKGYLPEMRAFLQLWIDTVSQAIQQGLTLEEAQQKISFLDRYPMNKGNEAMGPELQRVNIARLYEVLKRG